MSTFVESCRKVAEKKHHAAHPQAARQKKVRPRGKQDPTPDSNTQAPQISSALLCAEVG
jgi:hypothetical protein